MPWHFGISWFALTPFASIHETEISRDIYYHIVPYASSFAYYAIYLNKGGKANGIW